MLSASNTQATRAIIIDRGNDPPAALTPIGRAKATAAAGAMSEMDWNKTSGNPMAFRRNPVSAVAVVVASALLVDIRYLEKKLKGQQELCSFVQQATCQPGRLLETIASARTEVRSPV